jgi:succinoglycan biosynthesis protein ExoV
VKLYYYPLQNFGDRPLNTWLWPQLLPDQLGEDSQTLLVGIGSLLNSSLPPQPLKAIFSTGAGYYQPVRPDARWRVYCVRGPLTARLLGLAPELAVTDGAVLVRTLGLPPQPKTYPVAYMPHWNSAHHGHWRQICAEAGVHFIDPADTASSIVADIQRSQLLMSEALHGAIVADALRVPWVPVKAYWHVLDLKWRDWCESLAMAYQPARLPGWYQARSVADKLRRLTAGRLPAGLSARLVSLCANLAAPVYRYGLSRTARALGRLARDARPLLSSDQMLDQATSRLLEKLECLKGDVARGHLSAAEF